MCTRLIRITGNYHKVFVEIAGKPFIDYQIEYLLSKGVDKIIFTMGFGTFELEQYLIGKHDYICFSIQEKKLRKGEKFSWL
jgi:CTP:phosphocholine cytidylyltransferase-like protein